MFHKLDEFPLLEKDDYIGFSHRKKKGVILLVTFLLLFQ